jgi:hypothetical protein
MDNQMLRALFAACIEANSILNLDDPLAAEFASVRDRLPKNAVGQKGQLLEWREEVPEMTPGMGHISHLWGAYPGTEINWRDTPELTQAVRQSLKLRMDNGAGRGGWPLAWYICEHAIAGGVDALIVHGRTTSQYFRGKADWTVIAELKKKYPQTTIIGSGDLFEPDDIIAKMKSTGIDGVAIARGAIGRPWIFRQVIDTLEGKTECYQPDVSEQGRIIVDHLDLLGELYEPKKRVWYFRKFLAHYSKYHAGEKRKLKMQLVGAADEDQLRAVIKNHYNV